ncbi:MULTISPECIES: DNA polymerase III subunit beta [Sediminispirochaeta]|jgi:DNA polymerase-3 subunit beta|uniref:Beta sliding clamp n=1 Tax=Sediminispirochaeta smaragdinae (strain DSM 11293 / JCM 15392 / SEBR 4228) TaxID=573413 RepID=E1R6N1_SEDSS|nr:MULTISPECIES: DNA polymerase III subunit beta [Sediminispirochaeta]ADK79163.1 DNA polymerase III, beta subunit [Sediminispirochaeta smaragdinae DSM 11293]
MKFTCEKNALLKEISIAQEIISTRNALSILSNVLLEADDGSLTIKATDLKVSFETRIPVEIAAPGSTTVFCDKFLGILRSLPEGDIEVELVDNRVMIRPLFQKINFQLKSIAGDKFPELQEVSEDLYFEIPQKDLIEMIGQTIFAVSDDETRYYMNGVYVEQDGESISMVATDGRRLSLIKRRIESELKEFDAVIIPPKVLQLIRKLSSGEGNLKIAISDRNIFVQFDDQRITSNLIEGQFPNYRRVIPDSQDYQLVVNRDQLEEALKRVSLLVEQKSRRVYLSVENAMMRLTSEESDIGVAKEELSCSYEGPETTIALNYLYLAEPLKVMRCEEVVLRFTEANKAITLEPVPEGDYFHIIMPMQLD